MFQVIKYKKRYKAPLGNPPLYENDRRNYLIPQKHKEELNVSLIITINRYFSCIIQLK